MNMKKFKLVLTITVTILFSGLLFGVLGAILFRTAGEGIWQIGNFCKLGKTSAYDTSVYCQGMDQYIKPNVVGVGWNNNFIVAVTHPLWTDPKYPQCTDCFQNESITYWWILDVKNKILYGPISSEQEFITQKSQKGVGDISLWTVDEAKTHAIISP